LAFENKFRGSSENLNDKLSFYDEILNEVLSRFPKCKLLDIGSGRGEWLIKCQQLGIQSMGIDNNLSMFNYCSDKGLTIKHGDALEILKTFEDNSFQLITSFHFIEHISFDLILEILDQCKRILVPGGVLILETPSIDNILVSSKSFYLDPTHVTHIHPEAIKFALEYLEFKETNYYLLNTEKKFNTSQHAFSRLYNGVGQDVTVISRLEHPTQQSLFDANLSWIKNLEISKNTLEILSEYDHFHDIKSKNIDRLANDMNMVNSQIDHLIYSYNRIFNSKPVKIYRKLKSLVLFLKVKPIKVIKLILPFILRIKFLKKSYSKFLGLLLVVNEKYVYKTMKIPLRTKKNTLQADAKVKEADLLNFFNSNGRSREILSDIKLRSKIK